MQHGLIFQHLWPTQTHPLEQQCHDNIKKLIHSLPIDTPVLSYDVKIKDIVDLLQQRFTKVNLFVELVHADKEIKKIMRDWIEQHNLKYIYVAGLHFNCCVMQCTTKLREICFEKKRQWNWDFVVRVIEDSTISLHHNQTEPCLLKDTTLYMNYAEVKPWLISSSEVLDNVR